MRHNSDGYSFHRAISDGYNPLRPVGNIKFGHHLERRGWSKDIINKWLIALAFFIVLFSEIIAEWLEKIINLVI